MKWRLLACILAFLLAECKGGAGSSNGAFIPSNRAAAAKIVSLTLLAAMDPSNGFPTFVYNDGYDVTPTIHVRPGDSLEIFLTDSLPAGKGMADDVNLHFHGLSASPQAPADDVLTMLAKPGQSLHYVVPIPKDQPPGLYWYHTHVHGETNYQVGEGGMSGAIIVDGIAAHLPALAHMPENVLIVRELGSGAGSVVRIGDARNPRPCAPVKNSVLSVNRVYLPKISIRPNKPQFFRILNATGHRTLDLSIDGTPLRVVAIDGYPLDTYPGESATMTVSHYVLPPAARVEFVATPKRATTLRTNCYDSGPAGDPDPPAVLAYLGKAARAQGESATAQELPGSEGVRNPPAALPAPAATRVVRFSENAKGFYINGRAFSPKEPPAFVVHTGTVERWTVENLTHEVHVFHLHQVHFVVETIDGARVTHRHWADTVVVPYGVRLSNGAFRPGKITLIADFRSPLIRGTFLFHCHILDHEDRGMMAKIQAI
jgi:FtsP/CotA-like multicopper oxidase with cupredoxin domain